MQRRDATRGAKGVEASALPRRHVVAVPKVDERLRLLKCTDVNAMRQLPVTACRFQQICPLEAFGALAAASGPAPNVTVCAPGDRVQGKIIGADLFSLCVDFKLAAWIVLNGFYCACLVSVDRVWLFCRSCGDQCRCLLCIVCCECGMSCVHI